MCARSLLRSPHMKQDGRKDGQKLRFGTEIKGTEEPRRLQHYHAVQALLATTKLLSASRDSTSNLKKHLEVSWRIVSAKASYTRHNFQCLKRYDSPSPKSG